MEETIQAVCNLLNVSIVPRLRPGQIVRQEYEYYNFSTCKKRIPVSQFESTCYFLEGTGPSRIKLNGGGFVYKFYIPKLKCIIRIVTNYKNDKHQKTFK